MHICYIDEAGCTGQLQGPNSDVQPVFALVGLMMPHSCIKQITHDWINLKQRHYPGLLPEQPVPRFHDWMAAEVKGAELRKLAKRPDRNKRRFASHVIARCFDILERHQVRIAGKVFTKPLGAAFNGVAVYTSTAQTICATFQNYLAHFDADGMVIADSRQKWSNANVSHSIFTQRHRAAGDPYPNLVEAPTFGHSDNHAGLQLADVVCSALLFPIAAQVCCARHLANQLHCSPHFLQLRQLFGARLRRLQWQHTGRDGRPAGGINLQDSLGGLKTSALFVAPTAPAPLTDQSAATGGPDSQWV